MARGREKMHMEGDWSETEPKDSVRKEAQGTARGGCTVQGRPINNQKCKKQSDISGVKCIGAETLSCLASNKFIAKRQPCMCNGYAQPPHRLSHIAAIQKVLVF